MTQTTLRTELATGAVLILDGALATELARRGASLNDPLWSAKILLENPALISAVHRDYFEAGADIATTASYQASFEGFARRGLDAQEATQVMQASVELALDARDAFWSVASNRVGRRRPLVAASIGPYGATLADGSEYRGKYGLSRQALMDFHRPRMRVLAESADLLACETVPCLIEAEAIARLLDELSGMEAWIAFSCKDSRRTCEGQLISECAQALDSFVNVSAIGVNCSDPELITPLIGEIRMCTDKPIVVYPNSGERYDPVEKIWAGDCLTKPLSAYAGEWIDAGARVIGGCCRTTPGDIRQLRLYADAR